MNIIARLLQDVLLLKPPMRQEAQGRHIRIARSSLEALGIDAPFVQDNHSRSIRNVLRGLHYQIAQPQGKLVRVIAGEIFDVAVDLRLGSATFGQAASMRLSADNGHIAWIPPGFAHGFQVLSERVDFLYSVTDYRYPEHERILLWSDPALGIDWPLGNQEPILSPKDQQGMSLAHTVAMLRQFSAGNG
ncbi:MAG: dTDP-4-dehydrorhamnose 3,5-epimerase [Magnetococcales bacterium]|nr:dTDP-4-dehydrorhamnose 3,5-epimerase [Magnetococcales bacterium]